MIEEAHVLCMLSSTLVRQFQVESVVKRFSEASNRIEEGLNVMCCVSGRI